MPRPKWVIGSGVGLACTVACAAAGLGGCNAFGPAALASGRGLYNEVINKTEDEQVLNMIVRMRYDETFGMLAVASVTASVSVSANAGSEFRAWGNADDTAGNLVPLSAGVAYEENPTISYVPLSGEAHLSRLLGRMTLDEVYMISGLSPQKDVWMRESIASINGLINPRAYGKPPSPAFDRFIEAYTRLVDDHVAAFGRTLGSERDEEQYFISIHDYADEHEDDVRAFLDVLGIEGVAVDGPQIVLPVRWSHGMRSSDAIDVATRSPIDVIRSAGTMVEVPAPHLQAGIAEPIAWEVREQDKFITIRSSETRPQDAMVAVRFRDWWFYIDATDTRSKQAFGLIRVLLGIQMADKGAPVAPIITIPAN